MVQPGNQVLSFPHMMEGQTHTELGCSIHCSHIMYCFKLYFLISVTSFHFYGEWINKNLSSHQVGKAQCPEWTESCHYQTQSTLLPLSSGSILTVPLISALMVMTYSQSRVVAGVLGRGQVREGGSAIISFPTICFQKLVTPQYAFPWWKMTMFGVCPKENLYGKFEKHPLWLGKWKKPVPFPFGEKKERTYLKCGYFCLCFRRSWLG